MYNTGCPLDFTVKALASGHVTVVLARTGIWTFARQDGMSKEVDRPDFQSHSRIKPPADCRGAPAHDKRMSK